MQTGYDALASAEKLFPTNVKEQLTAKAKDIENAANKAKDDAFASFEKAHKADIEAAEKSVKEYKQKLKDIAAGREVKYLKTNSKGELFTARSFSFLAAKNVDYSSLRLI